MNKLTVKQEKKIGRPSSKTEDRANAIIDRIAEGESLRGICRDEEMPTVGTFLKWVAEDTILMKQYARAMELRAEVVFDEMQEIADDATNDFMDKQNQDGSIGDKALNAEHIQRSKLRIDTRKWILSRMNPKKYGDNSKLLLGNDPENPLTALMAQISGSTLKPNDDTE
jgi:hypothetical protein